MKDYIIKEGKIYMRNISGGGYSGTIVECIEWLVMNDTDLVWFLSHYNLDEETENIVIETYKRIKLEREYQFKKAKEMKKRIMIKLK